MLIETEDYCCSRCWAEIEPGKDLCEKCQDEDLKDIQFDIDCAQGKI